VIPLVKAAFPDLLERGCLRAGAGWLVPPAVLGSSPADVAGELQCILFPHYNPDGPFELSRLSGASTAVALTRLLINARNLPEHGFPELLRLARGLPAYQLTYGHCDQASEALRALI
jgi:hypothetical protein